MRILQNVVSSVAKPICAECVHALCKEQHAGQCGHIHMGLHLTELLTTYERL
jgi:hypothetical protein